MIRNPNFERAHGADRSQRSVGLYDPPRSRTRGEEVVFGPDEIVRVRDAIGSVLVQAIGGPLPDWVRPRAILDRCPTVELVLLRAAPWIDGQDGRCPRRLLALSPLLRWVVHDTALENRLNGEGALPHASLRVSAEEGDLDTVALALAAYARGNERLMGCDLSDIAAATGAGGDLTADGRAVVVAGQGDAAVGARLRDALGALTAEGYSGGRLLLQLLRKRDFPTFTLERFDACITAACADDAECVWIATAMPAHDRTALALIAFRPPHATADALRLRALREGRRTDLEVPPVAQDQATD